MNKSKLFGYMMDLIIISSLVMYCRTGNKSFENVIVFMSVVLFIIYILGSIVVCALNKLSIEEKAKCLKLDKIKEYNIVEHTYHFITDIIMVFGVISLEWFVIGLIWLLIIFMSRGIQKSVLCMKSDIQQYVTI